MKTIGARIRYVIEKEGYSVLSFAKEHAMNYSGLTQVIKNKRPLGMEVLQQLKAALPKINTEWLLYGNQHFENISEYVNVDNPNSVLVVQNNDESDPFELVFLQYLERPHIQERIKQILKS